MALSVDQYASIKLTLRALLSGSNISPANLSEPDLLSFWKQLLDDPLTDSNQLGQAALGSIDFAFRSRLCSAIGRVPDFDWWSFFHQLGSDSVGASALSTQRYAGLKLQLRAVLSAYQLIGNGLTDAQAIGYIKSFGGGYANSAELTSINASNNFACVGGVGGNPPQFTTGSTMVALFRVNGGGAHLAQFGLLASSRGWAVGIDGATNNPYVRAYGNAATVLPNLGSGFSTAMNTIFLRMVLTVTGGNLRGSVNGCNVCTAAWPVYTGANAGDTFTLGGNELGGNVSNLYAFAMLDRAFSDSELVSNSAIQDNRYDLSAILADANCKLFWTAKDDWDGSSSTSVTRGSSPLTMTKVGIPARTTFSEVRIAIGSADKNDSSGEQVSGSGANIKRLCSEYAATSFVVGSDTSADFDDIGDNGTYSTYDVYKNSAYAISPNGVYLSPDNTRRSLSRAVLGGFATGDALEFVDSFQTIPPAARIGSTIQAVRFRTGAQPWLVRRFAPARRLVIVGDSIPSGQNASVARNGWGRLVRADYPGRVTFLCYGGAAIADYAANIPALAALVVAACNQGGAVTTKEVWIELGVNDGVSGSVFNTPYAALLDGIRALDPAIRIYCQSLGVTTGGAEAAWVLQQRIDIAAMCAARSWTTYVDGLTMYTSGQLTLGVHPGDAGHLAVHDRVKAVVGY